MIWWEHHLFAGISNQLMALVCELIFSFIVFVY